jgi:hypothetical protein
MAAMLTVIAVMTLVQLVLAAYVQGVARAAADEAVRTGSRVAAGIEVCRLRGSEVFTSLLPGPIGRDYTVACTAEGNELVSTVIVIVDSPTPGFPNLTITATGRATQET